jgi:hypothetical protein
MLPPVGLSERWVQREKALKPGVTPRWGNSARVRLVGGSVGVGWFLLEGRVAPGAGAHRTAGGRGSLSPSGRDGGRSAT